MAELKDEMDEKWAIKKGELSWLDGWGSIWTIWEACLGENCWSLVGEKAVAESMMVECEGTWNIAVKGRIGWSRMEDGSDFQAFL